MIRFILPLLFATPAFAYDANGVAPGDSEGMVRKQFPSAFCKPLEWSSDAADRRCDDAKANLGGVSGRITFYLKHDRVQAFDLRFDNRDAERLVAYLKKHYGAPVDESREKLYRVQWEKGDQRAVVVAQGEKRRASLSVSRGKFEDEIYRIR